MYIWIYDISPLYKHAIMNRNIIYQENYYTYINASRNIYIIYTQNRLCCRLLETVYVLPPFTDHVMMCPLPPCRHDPCVINGGTDTSYQKSTHKM